MKPRVERVRALMEERQWSASELARRMGVSRSESTRFLNGKRKGGNKVISGLMRAFPDEPMESLFFLPELYPNVNINEKCVSLEKPPDNPDSVAIKHPDAHQLACTINRENGIVEIKQGKLTTTLEVARGPINVTYYNTSKAE